MPWEGSVSVTPAEHSTCPTPGLYLWTRLGRVWRCPRCSRRWSVQPIEDSFGQARMYWREEDGE